MYSVYCYTWVIPWIFVGQLLNIWEIKSVITTRHLQFMQTDTHGVCKITDLDILHISYTLFFFIRMC